MPVTDFKYMWDGPVPQASIVKFEEFTAPPSMRYTLKGKEANAVFAPLSGKVTSITSRKVVAGGFLFRVLISTVLPDNSVITNNLGELATITVKMGDPVVRGAIIGTTPKTTLGVFNVNLDWFCEVLPGGLKAAKAVDQNPFKLAEQMGGIQDPLSGTQPEFPPGQEPVPAPAPRGGSAAPSGLSGLMPILLVGGAAWFFLGKKKKGRK